MTILVLHQPNKADANILHPINHEKPIKDYLTKYRQSELQFITGWTCKGIESLADYGVVKQSQKINPPNTEVLGGFISLFYAHDRKIMAGPKELGSLENHSRIL